VEPRIEQLAERPDWLPVVAEWIYGQWWTTVEGASVATLSNLLQGHRVLDRIPLTLIASWDSRPIGTATLLAHDIGSERWPDLSPWLAALYVVPEFRRRGVGAALVNATASKAAALGAEMLYLNTVDREQFYSDLGWQVIDRHERKVVMSRSLSTSARSRYPSIVKV